MSINYNRSITPGVCLAFIPTMRVYKMNNLVANYLSYCRVMSHFCLLTMRSLFAIANTMMIILIHTIVDAFLIFQLIELRSILVNDYFALMNLE